MMDLPSDNELILEVKHPRPMSASDLSQLLGDMARDYRRFSRGRELIVAGLNEAPRMVFRDAMDGAGASRLPAFGKRLARLLALAQGGGDSYKLRKTGAPAVESLTRLAMACESAWELRYRGAKGERLLFTLTPGEARTAQEHIGLAKQRKREIAAARKEERERWPAATPSSDSELRAILSQWTNQAEE
jgi:hypothetical protein